MVHLTVHLILCLTVVLDGEIKFTNNAAPVGALDEALDGALAGRRWCPLMVHLMVDLIPPVVVH